MAFKKGNQNKDKIDQLCDYIDRSSAIVATTGAGISLSGGGVTYGQMRVSGVRGGSGRDSFLYNFRRQMFEYDPSFSHYALKDLEDEGKLIGIITTNVDCMHTKAGSKNVAEIQGSFQVNCCAQCGRHYDGYEIWNQKELPRCEVCGGQIQPWPLYSGISLWDKDVEKAREWISQADLILAIGTHGYFSGCYWGCRRRDAVLVQINPGHTGFDSEAVLNIREGCDEVFRQVQERRGRNGRQ